MERRTKLAEMVITNEIHHATASIMNLNNFYFCVANNGGLVSTILLISFLFLCLACLEEFFQVLRLIENCHIAHKYYFLTQANKPQLLKQFSQ
jgi:hypothetical protein